MNKVDLCKELNDNFLRYAEATNSECVGVIGGSMIFYRYNPELHKDEKKKAKGRK